MNRLLLGLMALAVTAGCASTHPAEVGDREAPYQDKGRIQWNSTNLKSVLVIDKAASERTPDGLLRVRLVLRNTTRQDVVVDIHTVFTDQQGFEKQKTPWEPVVCTARTQTTYEIVSLGADVDDFQMIIRDPKKFSWQP